MFCAGQGQIVITSGDTGIAGFIPAEGSCKPGANDRAVFTVRDRIGGRKLIEKTLEPDGEGIIRVPFIPEDTEKLRAREYVFDIRYYLDAQEDGKGNITAYRERITPMEAGFLLVLPAIGGER